MKNIVFGTMIIASFFSAIATHRPVLAEWVHFGTDPNGSETFIDDQSFKFEEGVLHLWVKEIFDKPKKIDAIGDFYFNLTDSHWLINCPERTLAVKTVIFYDENGEVIHQFSLNMTQLAWRDPPPGNSPEAIMRVHCDLLEQN
ncbi:surface-adhesin E family protein [Thiorhodovibrio frisius]|uniref:Surface-adhesin protein E-like domain-containing protein n=1 Tax=Thiorhodovibrio frisius TaxID=631362 RepID=H8Z5E0_9GAMM|nr:surface-adhesin E family protein [Thiorhodovibrio frisius]EIC19486.1 hypothetical protein Thi970DRAFT_03063 [Thiorhodovibrio frisius]WPL20551.1 hypothetical protein Thiofri_00650 [Thiorhodovibrio frisius]